MLIGRKFSYDGASLHCFGNIELQLLFTCFRYWLESVALEHVDTWRTYINEVRIVGGRVAMNFGEMES